MPIFTGNKFTNHHQYLHLPFANLVIFEDFQGFNPGAPIPIWAQPKYWWIAEALYHQTHQTLWHIRQIGGLVLSGFHFIRGQGTIIHLVPYRNGHSEGLIFRRAIVAIRAHYHKVALIVNIVRDLWRSATATIVQFHGAPSVWGWVVQVNVPSLLKEVNPIPRLPRTTTSRRR